MENKRIKVFFALGGIVALLAIMLFAAVTFADNIKKEADVKAVNEVQNSSNISNEETSLKIKFQFQGVTSGSIYVAEYGEDDTNYFEIKNGESFSLPTGIASYDIDWGHDNNYYAITCLYPDGSLEGFYLDVYGSFGYKIKENWVLSEATGINKNIEAKVTLENVPENERLFKGRIIDSAKKGVPYPNVLMYDINGKLIDGLTVKNDDKGNFSVVIKDKSLTNGYFAITSSEGQLEDYINNFETRDFKNSVYDIKEENIKPADILIDASEHIGTFKIYQYDATGDSVKEGTYFAPRGYVKADLDKIDYEHCDVTFKVEDDASMLCEVKMKAEFDPSQTIMNKSKITPIIDDGFDFDCWTINGKNYYKGDSAPEMKGATLLSGSANVKGGDDPTPPSPDPTPTPVTPTSDVVSGNKTSIAAKTGDALPLGIVFALIGVAGASAFVARKRSKK